MRKIAYLFAFLLLSAYSFAQENIYIRFDESCMDKLEYRFVADANAIQYTAYRFKNYIGDYIYLETGVESPIVQRNAPEKMISCQNATLDQSDIKSINLTQTKIYVCKQLDSGWAIFTVGSASYMAYHDNDLTFLSPKYEIQADLGTARGQDVTIKYPTEESVSTMYYLGEISACNSVAYMFKMTPSDICHVDADVTIHPQLGLVREKLLDSDMFELVSINDVFVCDYLSPQPVNIASAEPQQTVYSENTEGVNITYTQPTYTSTETQESNYSSTEDVVSSKSITDMPKSDCGVLAKDGEHLVAQGESLYGIARLYGLSVNSLRSWNNISTDVIQPCSVLRVVAPIAPIPPTMTEARDNEVPMSYNTKSAAAKKEMPLSYDLKTFTITAKSAKKKIECTNVANENEHVVQQGESLYGIAHQYDLKASDLAAWNKLTNDIVHPCDVISLAAPAKPKVTEKKVVVKTTKTNVSPKSAPKSYSTVVKPKEVKKTTVVTPKSPAKKVTTTETTEKALMVKKGSGLYVVKKGETISSLAQRFNLDEAEFRKINNLSKTEIVYAGQVIKTQNCACVVEEELPQTYNEVVVSTKKVPSSYNTVAMPKPIKVKEATQATVTAKGGIGDDKRRKYHVVQQSETLYTIAKMYGTSVEKLRESNNIADSEVILPNQLLVLE